MYNCKPLNMKNSIWFVFLFLSFPLFSQNKEAYKIFTGNGNVSSYDSLVGACKDADFVFFGELHDNPISHWLEFELTRDLYSAKKEDLVVGAEMFEADNQLILSEFLQGKMNDKKFEEEGILWPNYKTDYKPFVVYCKKNKIPFIATNIPRRYASMVSKGGFEVLDSLSNEAKTFIAPLPITYDENLVCYKSMLDMKGMGGMNKPNPNLPKAQAAKDATMSYFILKNWKRGNLFLHFNGCYHSNNHEGIVWYLKNEKKKCKIIVINTITQEVMAKLNDENKSTGDFIICVPESMTRTQ